MLRKILFGILLVFLMLPVANSQEFIHDFDTAKQMASENDKPILMIFSGSDWCKPCIRLRRTVLEAERFTAFAEKKLILMEVDFPYKKKNRLPKVQRKHNDSLAAKYNSTGEFPLILLLDKSGAVLDQYKFGNKMTAETLEKAISDTALRLASRH